MSKNNEPMSEQERNIIYRALCNQFINDIGNIKDKFGQSDTLIINNLLTKYEPYYYKDTKNS